MIEGSRDSVSRRLELAVLDMVGTTVRADDQVPEAFCEAFRAFGLTVSREQVRAVRGRSKTDAIQRLTTTLSADSSEVDQTSRGVYVRFKELLREKYASSAEPIEGAQTAIDWLRKREVGVVLTTGLDRETARTILTRLGWGRRVDGLICADDVEHGRPAPDLIRAAMKAMGIDDPGCVLAAGDTVADLEAAEAAGVRWSVGVTSGAHGRETLRNSRHSALLSSVAELPAWVEGEIRVIGRREV